ncbi:MAG: phenazine biosynthesis protein PhzF [Burkholderiales bacterium PBB3]|nr:MAG: phenazine biosynthesis protein PhzF [Burkholderiales bacterium PBB3]
MRTTRPFAQVDVFTALPYLGNPLAVVLDGAGLSDAGMQAFARWTNLSETTFLLPPSAEAQAQGADYRVRIFTPGGELPFAGHPTLGSCHAWLEAGGTPRATDTIVQECQAGLIRIQLQSSDGSARLAFGAPPLKRSNPSPKLLAQVAAALGLKPAHIIAAQHLDNGPQWLGLLLDSPQTVLQVQPDHNALKDLGQKVGLVAVDSAGAAPVLIARGNREARAFGARSADATLADTAPDAEQPALEVRAFAAPLGINEDPVTGSLNASLAQWLIADGYAPSDYIAAQGSCIGREGRVHIHQDAAGQVWVGGSSVTCIRGQVTL